MVDLHVGDSNVRARVRMRDANGNETDSYDVAGGVTWASSDPSKVAITDDDADPKDARVVVLALTGGAPVWLNVSFDGDPGDGTRAVEAQSEDINVVPGDATTAEVVIEFTTI
jgi:hypothetical protein